MTINWWATFVARNLPSKDAAGGGLSTASTQGSLAATIWPFDTSGFQPLRQSGPGWADEPWLGWMHVSCDVLIALAYFVFLAVFLRFAARYKSDQGSTPPVFWLFAVLVAVCGIGHVLDAIVFYSPVFRLAGLVKVATAFAWISMLVTFLRFFPFAMKFADVSYLEAQLQREVEERQRAEQSFQAHNRSLELRIKKRTAELESRAERLVEANRELELFNEMAVEREDRIIALKRDVNALATRLGENAPYDLSFVETESGVASL